MYRVIVNTITYETLFRGTREQCLRFLRFSFNKYPDIDLINMETGRFVSWVI